MAMTLGEKIALESVLITDVNTKLSFDDYIELLHEEGELTICEMFELDTADNLEDFIRDLAERIDRAISLKFLR